MSETPARTAARILIQTESVLFSPDEPFTFTSGRKSPVYVDCRRLISFPNERGILMGMMADQIKDTVDVKKIDAIAGGETAGIPFAAWIADRLGLPMIYIRKKPKGFGRNARIEGIVDEGNNIVLIEDLATDGGSKMSFIEGIRDAGAECALTFVVFHYGIFPEGIKKLNAAGVALHGLTTWWDIIECAEEEKILDADTVKKVTAFLKDPDGWKAP
jgi:orotate phosphoribosyltransferase